MLGLARIAQSHRSGASPGIITSRYIRLNFPLGISGSDGYMSLQRARFSLSSTVLVFGTYPSIVTNQSSEYGTAYSAAAAFTNAAPTAGAVSAGWTTPTAQRFIVPQWIEIDFGSAITFDEIDVYPDGIANRNPATIQVQTSPDNTTWNTIWHRTGLTYPTTTWYQITVATS